MKKMMAIAFCILAAGSALADGTGSLIVTCNNGISRSADRAYIKGTTLVLRKYDNQYPTRNGNRAYTSETIYNANCAISAVVNNEDDQYPRRDDGQYPRRNP